MIYTPIQLPPTAEGGTFSLTNTTSLKLTIYTGEPDVPVVELDPGDWLTIGELDE